MGISLVLREAHDHVLANNPDKALKGLRGYFQKNGFHASAVLGVDQFLSENSVVLEGSSWETCRVAVLGSATTQAIVAAVRCSLLLEFQQAVIYESGFGTFAQEILSEGGALLDFDPDIVLVAVDAPIAPIFPATPRDGGQIDEVLAGELTHWRRLWTAYSRRFRCPMIQHLLMPPTETGIGVAERYAPWGSRRLCESLNEAYVSEGPGFIRWIDIDSIAQIVGTTNWRDPRLFFFGKYPFNPKYLGHYAFAFLGAWRSAMARQKKLMVVDLDNTLWGGVIGDDGLDGLQLGPGTPEGEAYHYFCTYLRSLKAKGVLLAVASKNDFDIAMEVFDLHPHMPLKRSDFAAIECNWEDKPSSLRRIATKLNLDISSLVFADDNAAECDFVRRELPEVTVVNLAGDPAHFSTLIDGMHLFDAHSLSNEDLLRAQSYSGRAEAAILEAQIADMDGYLASLGMCARNLKLGEAEIGRLAQMEMKTNQFNLTTRRRTREQIEQQFVDRDGVVLAFALSDRFADHGLVAYVAATKRGPDLWITDWLMSCRVFSRTLEQFCFNTVLQEAKRRGAVAIVGEYVSTPKSRVVTDLYPRLGFSPYADAPSLDSDRQLWRLITETAVPLKTWVEDATVLASSLGIPGSGGRPRIN